MAGGSARVQGVQEAQERPEQTEGSCAGTSDPRRLAPYDAETSGCHHELSGPVPERRNGGGLGGRQRRTAHLLSECVGAGNCPVRRDGRASKGPDPMKARLVFMPLCLGGVANGSRQTPAFSESKIGCCPTLPSHRSFDTGRITTRGDFMDLELLTKRYFRLAQELSLEYRARPWVSSRIDRIANDIAATERAIAELQSSAQRGAPLSMGPAQYDQN